MINTAGAKLITESEEIKLTAYLCPAGVPTIGRGHTKGITHQMVKDGYTITVDQERELFRQDMEEWAADVLACLVRKPNENQLAAMVSFAFNVGLAGFKKSTVLRAFEAYDDEAAAKAFGLWKKATVDGKKVVMKGLVIRRAKEAALFLTPVIQSVEAMPQKIEPEKPLITSTTMVAGSTATLAMLTQVVDSVNKFKGSVAGLGDWMIPAFAVIGLGACGWVLYERYKNRIRGSI